VIDPTGPLPYFARFGPNPNFQSEELNGYEAGYRRLLFRKLYLDIDAFYNHYGNLFSEDVIGQPFVETTLPFGQSAPPHILLPAQFGNGLVGTTRGVEIAPEWRPVDYIRVRGSYSFLNMDVRRGTNSLDIGTAPFVNGSSPEHQMTAESDFSFLKRFRLDLIYRYVSALSAIQIPAYSTGDAQLELNLHRGITFSVVGQNLAQPFHYESSSDPGPTVGIARSAYVKLSWTRE
jgi:iron complex outermembrane receptor protein